MAFLRKFLIAFLLVVAMASLTAIFGLATNWVSGLVTPDQLQQFLGENFFWKLVGILVVCAVLLAMLTVYGEKWLSKSENNTKPTSKNFEPEIRDWLLKRYQNRLDQKLAGRMPINLRRIDFSETAAQLSQKQFKEIAPETIQAELTKFFREAEGRLLVVGAPGAGKTTLLLDLAVKLLETESDALPAVINLATWSSEFKTLEDWLKKILPVELGVTTALAVRLLAESRVILLFDGLDEIPDAEQRAACIAAIDLFVSPARPRREFAISSRTQEFREAGHVPLVSFPIEVGALTMAQIERELTRRNPAQTEDRDLLAALKKDKLLREAAETPFYFNCLQLLFGENKRPVFSTTDRAGREREILDAFVENEVEKCSKPETQKWLSFLASRMNERGLIRFELKDLQYDWQIGDIHHEIFWAMFIHITIQNYVYYLTFGFSMYFVVRNNLLYGFLSIVFAIFILTRIEVFRKRIPMIDTAGLNEMNPKAIFQYLIRNPHSIFWGSLIGYEISKLVTTNISTKIFTAIIGGVICSIGLVYERFSEKHSKNLIQVRSSYERFQFAAKSLNLSIVQHFHLRYQLAQKGLLPLRLVDFLNEIANHQVKKRRFTHSPVHLMESDGASWRFRHRLIQEWFAARWVEPKP